VSSWCELATADLTEARYALNPTDNSVWLVAQIFEDLTVGDMTISPATGGSWALLHYDEYGALLGAFPTADVEDDPGLPSPSSISVDPEGNVYVLGAGMAADISFQTSTTPATLVNIPDTLPGDRFNALLVKFDAQGQYLWGFNFLAGEEVQAPFVDTNGTRVAVAFGIDLDINLTQVGVGTHGVGTLAGGGVGANTDVAVLSLDAATGAFQWAKVFGDADEQRPACVQVDAAGDVVVGGLFLEAINFNPGTPASELLMSAYDADGFLAKLGGSTGAHVWSQGVPIQGGLFRGCRLNPARTEVLVYGDFYAATLAVAGGPAITNPSLGDPFPFLAHLSGAGAHVFSKGFALAPAIPFGGALDSTGGFSIVGQAQGSLDLGGGALNGMLVGKFSSSGAHQDSQSFGALPLSAGVAVGDSDASFAFTSQSASAQVWRYRP
jgi:hypothetical protein